MDAYCWGSGGFSWHRSEWDLVIKKDETTYLPMIVIGYFDISKVAEVKQAVLIGYEVWIDEGVDPQKTRPE